MLREVSAAGSTVGSAQRCTTTTNTWSPLAPVPYSIKTSGDSLAYLVTQTHAVAGDKFQLDNLTLSTASADTTPPSMPTGFTVTGSTSTSISTSWKPSTDDVGVTGYKLGGPQVATTTATSYTFSTLVCGTSYALGVTALDAAGNTSPQAQLTGQTAPCQTGPPTPSLR